MYRLAKKIEYNPQPITRSIRTLHSSFSLTPSLIFEDEDDRYYPRS